MKRTFPAGFRWGAATAAHQVEGNNVANDWWDFEHREDTLCVEPSGDACDHYHRYGDDIELLAGLGFNTYRFSVEWSRIEPEEGHFSRSAVDHYVRMAASCRELGIEPVITMHHFTLPRWVAAKGGWTNEATIDGFVRFSRHVAERLGELPARVCTINEPNILSYYAYRVGAFPPADVDDRQFWFAQNVLRRAHTKAFDELKATLPSSTGVGLALGMSEYQATPAEDVLAAARLDRIRGDSEDWYLEACRGNDFIGVQTYSRRLVDRGGIAPLPGDRDRLIMGYDFYPEALAATIRRAHLVTAGVPVYISENGIGTDDDAQRIRYVRAALGGVLDCLDDGLPVLGYTYWSLLDNFEWTLGYGPRFGLIDVDRATQHRRVKPSASWLGAIARANALTDALI